MLRRRFVQILTAVGAGSLTTLASAHSQESKTVTYQVKGFSCITCAVGLDTMLKQRKGIEWSKSTYPDGMVTIKFNPEEVSEIALKAFIAEMGFAVAEQPVAPNQ